MSSVNSEVRNGGSSSVAAAQPRAASPAKIPVKVPYSLAKVPMPRLVPAKMPAPKRAAESEAQHRGNREDSDDALLESSAPSKKPKKEESKKAPLVETESSSSSEYSSSDSDDTDASDSESEGSKTSTVSDSSDISDDEESVSEDNLTFFELAERSGLMNDIKNKVNSGEGEQEEEEEVHIDGKPPRPKFLRSFPRDIEAEIGKHEKRLKDVENMLKMKQDNKTVSLGTSKVNYIDPRIVCSWANENNVPISRLFSATLQKKFPWALKARDFTF
ncbi:DNA topoisomerase type IB small subunit,putative [Trypanosoma brucei gambiense DAL972]|uniref:DNA topoisomerase type IB small subunit,putative n=3 Tax=Trypanosoma brucei TaxID=5691 RepID=C9ZXZ7_TRYB9|nr:DNA topoisomerase type IB small subunit,putative [Trypanosoma brucei gambiense DAL972]AAP78905.1 type IB DNA topoisomerase small subunit [Trypanosoma brucei]RHW70245.1 DNA topoisomerase type IB small subunit [Trypanosoma brucei equiperdum]CBH14292.1 DNA topoisomerase type IB small subunit,putative [Trypanosoma brucei gambiense DAL972]|eukprot:XP_011776562.1 DNA topoisomerase type IB small subunit,putative [Trypanosoma brucei gambiense DAL972]